ncbi:MAG: hypothetical protein K2M19_03820 [Muribaculaceae bacterium]|nr:hypothetical protein [Muribaculaceae bacterium]
MKSFINWCWTGFGTGMTSFRALGLAIITLLIGVIALYYVIRWIVRLFQKNSVQTAVD